MASFSKRSAESWPCAVCTFDNELNVVVCDACQSNRNSNQRPQLLSTGREVEDSLVIDRALAVSLAYKEAEDARTRREETNGAEVGVIFECSCCGHPNLSAWSECAICGGLSDAASTCVPLTCPSRDSEAHSPDWPEWSEDADEVLAQSLHGLWECTGCTALNPLAVHRCPVCHTFISRSTAEAIAAETESDMVFYLFTLHVLYLLLSY